MWINQNFENENIPLGMLIWWKETSRTLWRIINIDLILAKLTLKTSDWYLKVGLFYEESWSAKVQRVYKMQTRSPYFTKFTRWHISLSRSRTEKGTLSGPDQKADFTKIWSALYWLFAANLMAWKNFLLHVKLVTLE